MRLQPFNRLVIDLRLPLLWAVWVILGWLPLAGQSSFAAPSSGEAPEREQVVELPWEQVGAPLRPGATHDIRKWKMALGVFLVLAWIGVVWLTIATWIMILSLVLLIFSFQMTILAVVGTITFIRNWRRLRRERKN